MFVAKLYILVVYLYSLLFRITLSINANISVQVDDAYIAYVSYDNGVNYVNVSSNNAWHTTFNYFRIKNVTPSTILRFNCTDFVGGGRFAAQVEFDDGTQYFTTNPITNSNYELTWSSSGIIESSLTYQGNLNINAFHTDTASIVFGGRITFDFPFTNINIPTTGTPTSSPTTLAPTPSMDNPLNGQWTLVASPSMPEPNFRIPIGYNSNTNLVWMVGGTNGLNKIVSFNAITSTFTDYGSISPSIHAPYGKMYAQMDNILYFVAGVPVQSYTLYKMDLTNAAPNPQYITTIPQDWVNYGCIAGTESTDHYIFVIIDAAFLIYNINTNTWTNGPSMINRRQSMMAEVTNGKYLYVFGASASKTVEKIYVGDIANINSYSWTVLSDTLSSDKRYAGSVIYNQYIFIIGGTSLSTSIRSDTVDVIDTNTDTIVLATSLNEPLENASPVIIGQRIYAFGGINDDGQKSYYQYYNLAPIASSTANPTTATPTTPYPTTSNPTTSEPTAAPTYLVCDNVDELDWDLLNRNGSDIISSMMIYSEWNEVNLELSIDITLDYITRSSYKFVDQYDSDRGITYIIDTEAFLSDGRLINDANNCENRESVSFSGRDWSTEYWSYLNAENGLNSLSYLEYGPSGLWSLDWMNKCETIKYSATFSFSQLLSCSNKNNLNTFEWIQDVNWLNLSGIFYVTLVSPLINQNNIDYSSDIGQYLTNTIGNYPISLSFPKKIASIRDPGVILFDISIFAIQYDRNNNKLLVDILSYTANYIYLKKTNIISPISGYDRNNFVDTLIINEDDSYSGKECLFESTFKCFQKFQIEINLSLCPRSGIDLSSIIILRTEPSCRNNTNCSLFQSEFGTDGTTKDLTDNLFYTESCDENVYIQTFEGSIKYFTDLDFEQEVDDEFEFSIGQRMYVQVGVDDDIDEYGIFDINLLHSWICSSSDTDLQIISQLDGSGGCIDNYSSNIDKAINIDEIYQPFKDGMQYDVNLNGEIIKETPNNQTIRFSLIIPSFQRNKFWLHAIINLNLQNNAGRRRRSRLILQIDNNKMNRLSHYIKGSKLNTYPLQTYSSHHNDDETETNSAHTCFYFYTLYLLFVFYANFSVY